MMTIKTEIPLTRFLSKSLKNIVLPRPLNLLMFAVIAQRENHVFKNVASISCWKSHIQDEVYIMWTVRLTAM